MYARVASFEGRDPGLTDELIERVRERGPSRLPDAEGLLGLFDRDRGTALGITGSRTSVDTYEVTIQEGSGEGASAARVSSLEGSPDRIDESVSKAREETLPKVRELQGWKGIIGLADRNSGRVKLITLWENTEALQATEHPADRLREQAAESGGQRITGVDRYEVALAQRLSEVRV